MFAISLFTWLTFSHPNDPAKRSDAAMIANGEGLISGIFYPNGENVPEAQLYQDIYAYVKSGEKFTVKAVDVRTEHVNLENLDIAIYSPNNSSPIKSTTISNGAGYTETINVTEIGIYKLSLTGKKANFAPNQYIHYNVSTIVRNSSNAKIPGRTWTYGLNLRQEHVVNANITDKLYIVNDAGYIFELGLYEYSGWISLITADTIGNSISQDSCKSLYKSAGDDWNGENTYDKYYYKPNFNCQPYRIFFENPANAGLPESAKSMGAEKKILPATLNDQTKLATSLSFSRQAKTSNVGTFKLNGFSPNFSGNFYLEIDADGDGNYTGAKDKTIQLATAGGSGNNNFTYSFDGKDKTGMLIPITQKWNARVRFDKIGETHFVLSDIEGLGGITLEQIRGNKPGDATIYWGDSKLSLNNASGAALSPKTPRAFLRLTA